MLNSKQRNTTVFLRSVRRLLVAACVVPSSPVFCHPDEGGARFLQRRFLQEPHGVTTQKTPFFMMIICLVLLFYSIS
jgi:hypothetical protein